LSLVIISKKTIHRFSGYFQEVAQYDPITKSEGMFTDYINKFLKIKQEASGLPKWCKTDDDKRKYIQDYCLTCKAEREYMFLFWEEFYT
jgi:hypothetical protein